MMNHLWQSTFFGIFAGLLTLALRKNRANVRYWLWFSASLKFFVPFSLLMSLGSHVQWAPVAKTSATPAVSIVIEQVAQPFPETVPFASAKPDTREWVPISVLAVWACGFSAIALIRLRGWLRIRAAVRASIPMEIPATVEIRAAPGLLEPGVVGLFRPILLLPAGIAERLTPHQLEAVLAHELCHVRRRDNLTSVIHMIVEAVFWFHPLVWWIGARLLEERERACDEEVLRLGGEPQVYAEAILNVCKLYVESPLVCVSGVTGADLKKRIEAIMRNRGALRLTFAKKAALVVAGVTALAVPVAIGTLKAQSAAKPAPAFEVASVKACSNGEFGGTAKGGGRGGAGGGAQGPSPDRLNINCQPLKNLIRTAYLVFANGQRMIPGPTPPIEGGPTWIDSARYQITAKAEGTPGQNMMRGPMLQALLEDRFKLKIRRETREVPVYALTVAKNGPKLQPFEGGSCNTEFSRPPEPGQKPVPLCAVRWLSAIKPNSPVTWEVRGGSLDDLARALGGDLDRIVINRTGIQGKFDFQLEFTADETTAGLNQLRGPDGPIVTPSTASDPSGGPSIFTAIQQQLGLKLESAKGPREFLVIDRVEKPSEN